MPDEILHPESPVPTSTEQDGLPLISPDHEEVEHADEIDNVIPARGYSSLPVVALGGSAGSIPAMREFFENTSATSGFAYIVVLHLAPGHESTMPELLQRHTAMPVRSAEDEETLTPNTVFVIPPGKHLTVSDGHLRLTELQPERGRRVAVDLLFRSLADSHGPHATAIVLSGADGDGAIGLKRIKERGGLTIAQDPQEAEHGGMPGSAIATGMVDWVLKVADMPPRIAAYLARAARLRVPSEEGPQPAIATESTVDQSESLLREVLALLRSRTGRDFTYYKRATIVRRIARRMQVTGVEDLAHYLDHVRTNPGEAGALLQDLLISVTNFFRDREAFDAVAAQIPELFRHKKPGESVRVWCTACATGEEAYSMAILLLEQARKMESPPMLQVFGCDLDEVAIQTARAGFYPETISTDVSEERLRSFFVKESGGYRVRREVREMVLFAAHDLLKDAPFSRMDLVSCRNLLIYLNREAQARALATFNFSLKPGGLLFLGASETVQEASAMFVPLDKKNRIFRQRPVQRMNLPLSTGMGEMSFQRMLAQHERLKQAPAMMPGRAFINNQPSPVPEASADEPVLGADALHFKLLGHFGPSSLVVNTEHDILHLSENANRFLKFPEGVPTRNLLRLIHPMLRVDLRAALLRAGETGEPVDIFRRLVDLPGGPKAVDIRVTPAGELAPGYLLVVFEAREPTGGEAADIPLMSAALEPTAVVQQLERELTRANANLRANVEQYEASTEELKASNEELQAMNEELRSAGEELETGREELQSVNEELTTVNAEFKTRVDELARANSDLHNLMSATQIATVFLSRELRIMRYTPSAAPLFHFIPGDVGRPIADLKPWLDYPELTADAEQVLRTLVPVERELRDGGRWLLVRVLPYRTLEDHIAGVVLTFVDISERARAEETVRENAAWLHGQREALAAAVNGAPLETSLGALVRTATETLGDGTRAAFYLADDSRTGLHHVVGMPADYAAAVDGFKIGPESLACGLATHSGEPVITVDVQTDPRWAPWRGMAERFDYRGCWSFPIHSAAGVFVGTLAIYSRQPREATARELELASLLTNTASIILSRHQEARERQQAEEALAVEKKYAESIVETLHEPLLVLHPDLTVQSVNPAFYTHFKVNSAETVGRKVYELGNGQWNIPALRALLEDVLPESNAFNDHEVTHDFPSLGRRVMLVNGRRLDHVPLILLGIRDITERTRAEEAVRASEARLAATFESLPLGIGLANTDGRLVLSNKEMQRFFPTGTLPSMDDRYDRWLAYHPDGRRLERHEFAGARALRGETVVPGIEMLYTQDDGRQVWNSVAAVPVKDKEGHVSAVVLVVSDIDALKRTAEALRGSEEQFRRAIEEAPIPVIMHAEDGQVLQISRTWTELTGYTPEDMPTFDVWLNRAYGTGADQVRDHVRRLFQGEASVLNTELAIMTRDGERRHWAFSASAPGTLIDGRRFIVGMALDITERRHGEEALREAHEQLSSHTAQLDHLVQERTAKLQEMVDELEHVSYAIAHDMRAPLRAMHMFATLLSEEAAAGGSAQTQDYCRRLMAASNRLDQLILDSLHYTQAVQQEPPRGPVDLSKLMSELIETYPNLSADKADIAIEAGLPVVLANESLLTQCFSNLLGNAVKFVAPGTRPEVRVRAEVKDGRAKIWVEDNGIGIPQNAQARLFQMFQKLDNSYEGTGVGLAIVRKVTERMNGAVGVESEEGKGSRFWVELPLALATDENNGRPPTP